MIFLFKQKTAYEMRISDWSSDVCSSDLLTPEEARRQARKILGGAATGADPAAELKAKRKEMRIAELVDLYEKEGCYIQRGKRQGEAMKPLTKQYTLARIRHHVVPLPGSPRVRERSEERRVGKECVSRCSYRWWAVH